MPAVPALPAVVLAGLSTVALVAGVSVAGVLTGGEEPAPSAAPTAAPTAEPSPEPLALVVQAPEPPAPAHDPGDPATWSPRQLAAQLVFSCVQAGDLGTAVAQARAGIGGIAVMGRPTDGTALAKGLANVRAAGPHGIAPMLASDEEGGRVQRLRSLLGPLPSAAVMGGWSDERIEQTAHDYGVRMRKLGLQLALSPVADLAVPGHYTAQTQRAFSADPDRVTRAAVAWSTGLERAGVLSAVKHWPGHGSATDSHSSAPTVPPLSALEGRDLLPFDAVLEAGASIVMVGHLRSEGLTEPGVPATLSTSAMRVLRERAGPTTVVLTDSLSMGASSAALRISPAEAAVRSLLAGADWAMTCVDPMASVDAVETALVAGRLPTDSAVASARRILGVKHQLGLLGVPPSTAPPVGALETAEVLDGVVELRGQAVDPDSSGPVQVRLLLDGEPLDDLPAVDGEVVVRLPAATGAEICLVALNTGPGRSTPMGCVAVP